MSRTGDTAALAIIPVHPTATLTDKHARCAAVPFVIDSPCEVVMADPVITPLIETLKQQITFLELRQTTQAGDYLEAVLARQDLPRCQELLTAALGQAEKAVGQRGSLPPAYQKSVDELGGVRVDQGVFLKAAGASHVAYALLWPWDSDPKRVTLKVGLFQV